MTTLNPSDAVHKAWLYRLLIAISDNQALRTLYFKGGTAAALAGYLDRFSVDLDFDYVGTPEKLPALREELKSVFRNLGLKIKDESHNTPQFFLKYETKDGQARNTLKVDITFPPPKANRYEAIKLNDLGRLIVCQEKETMFANKLVAIIDRYERHQSLAGRDIYDIHHFFLSGFHYQPEVITERTGLMPREFFQKLLAFISQQITMTIIDQDLNPLLPSDKFKRIRKTLKGETEMFLRDEIKRLS